RRSGRADGKWPKQHGKVGEKRGRGLFKPALGQQLLAGPYAWGQAATVHAQSERGSPQMFRNRLKAPGSPSIRMRPAEIASSGLICPENKPRYAGISVWKTASAVESAPCRTWRSPSFIRT